MFFSVNPHQLHLDLHSEMLVNKETIPIQTYDPLNIVNQFIVNIQILFIFLLLVKQTNLID